MSVISSIPTTPKLTIISHSYWATENQKNLAYLSNEFEVQAVVPKWYIVNGKKTLGKRASVGGEFVRWVDAVGIGRGSFLFAPFGNLIAKQDPDVVNIEYAPWSPVTVQSAAIVSLRAPHAKLVLSVKKNTYRDSSLTRECIKKTLRFIVDKKVSGYIAASRRVADLYSNKLYVDPLRIFVCHHLGVDLDLFHPGTPPNYLSDSGAVIGYCGQFEARKGVPELVESIQALTNSVDHNVSLRLLGDGSMREMLVRNAKSLPWLSVEGPVQHAEVADFLRGCDIFAFPSRIEEDHEEHDGHALMEAMATGLPVVTTMSGIIPELVNDKCAFIVPERNPIALASAIGNLIGNPKARLLMGEQSRRLAEAEFGLAQVASRRAGIIKEILYGRQT